MNEIHRTIAAELSVDPARVEAAATLLEGGATVPFIARYRKEATGALDDTQLRTLESRLLYLKELGERKASILESIAGQGKLTPELEAEVRGADTKARLEDLYLPFKPKRRTKGQSAIEAGLLPLAEDLFANPELIPEGEAAKYVDPQKGVADVKAALEGAKYILLDRFSEDADLVGSLREYCWREGRLTSKVAEGREEAGAKYSDYFDHNEPIRLAPSHRALAMLRGGREEMLNLSLEVGEPTEDKLAYSPCEGMIALHFKIARKGRAADGWLAEVVRWTWRVRLASRIQTDLLARLRESAEEEAIRVFASNLKDLLLAAPAGHKAAIGLDPGLRTGVKVAVVDATGKYLDNATIYPLPPWSKTREAEEVLVRLAKAHGASLIAIGNGTGSRETDRFAIELMRNYPELHLAKVIVSEAGASVYSASEYGAQEFPDLDVTIRGAVSIARRLQDPLSELVKIDPKAIGVGQYQHDVNQLELARTLDAVVEDCVNAVGVDVNTASVPLLTRVSGLGRMAAKKIVELRDAKGAFKNREELKKVPHLGEKTYEQAAGFLRVVNGSNPLDSSSVHPESYPVVERIAARTGRSVETLIGDAGLLRSVNPKEYVDGRFGLPTVTDIIAELIKPGRDPRPEFKTATLADGVETMADLVPGMVLEGTVTNVTNFGAFIDIGVHQDGLAHISALSEKYIQNPREVVKAGDIVKVKVLEVDQARKRIALTLRMTDEPGPKSPDLRKVTASKGDTVRALKVEPPRTGFAALFEKAKKGR